MLSVQDGLLGALLPLSYILFLQVYPKEMSSRKLDCRAHSSLYPISSFLIGVSLEWKARLPAHYGRRTLTIREIVTATRLHRMVLGKAVA